jgi:hypothetical protein
VGKSRLLVICTFKEGRLSGEWSIGAEWNDGAGETEQDETDEEIDVVTD